MTQRIDPTFLVRARLVLEVFDLRDGRPLVRETSSGVETNVTREKLERVLVRVHQGACDDIRADAVLDNCLRNVDAELAARELARKDGGA